MAIAPFTKNYTDHSNSQGFQFEFHCDKCGSGFRSNFAASKLGMASSFLGAAADMFGGMLGNAAQAAGQVKDALRGKAWDEAYAAAIEECKTKFKQCRRCGGWVCPEVCWNAKQSQCKECSPDFQEEAASAQAHAAKSLLQQKAMRSEEIVSGVDFKKTQVGACPHCNAAAGEGKFCPECGKPLAATVACAQCKAQFPSSAKFCPECGAPRT